MANEINILQTQGAIQVNRRITPSPGDVLRFNSTSGYLENGYPSYVIAKSATFTEDSASAQYTASVTLPSGSTLHEIQIDCGGLWAAAVATLNVGDSLSTNGYFSSVNLKATDLLVGEQLRMSDSGLWGGRNGTYLDAASGRRGPNSNGNFGGKYQNVSSIFGIILVTGPSGSPTGKTFMTVTYSLADFVTVAIQ